VVIVFAPNSPKFSYSDELIVSLKKGRSTNLKAVFEKFVDASPEYRKKHAPEAVKQIRQRIFEANPEKYAKRRAAPVPFSKKVLHYVLAGTAALVCAGLIAAGIIAIKHWSDIKETASGVKDVITGEKAVKAEVKANVTLDDESGLQIAVDPGEAAAEMGRIMQNLLIQKMLKKGDISEEQLEELAM